MNIRSGTTWTKSAIALALLCAVFSFGVMAQDNSKKPLDAEAASALLQELTDGLPDLIDDEDAVEKITEKWEARQDLAGKTREQILKMLQADVRSVVNDPKLLDSIWKAWTAEAETDEEDQVETPQKPATPVVKTPQNPVAVVPPRSEVPKTLSESPYKPCSGYQSNGTFDSKWTGTIKMYNFAKGFGFILLDGDKEFSFFYARDVASPIDEESMTVGKRVMSRKCLSEDGNRVYDVDLGV